VSLALLFAGQGTQHAAMLPWLETCPDTAPALALIAAQLGAEWRTSLARPSGHTPTPWLNPC
jgi:[acyl-carrier-protein] S-malonyltransferase